MLQEAGRLHGDRCWRCWRSLLRPVNANGDASAGNAFEETTRPGFHGALMLLVM